MSKQEIIASSIEVPYDDLFRYNERYIGNVVHLTGQAVQVSETGNKDYIIRLSTKCHGFGVYSGDIVWVEINNADVRVLEDDMLDIYAEVVGIESYTTVLGNEVSLPAVVSRVYRIIDEDSVSTDFMSWGQDANRDIDDSETLDLEDRYKFRDAPHGNTISVKVGPTKRLSHYTTKIGEKSTKHEAQEGKEFLCVLVEVYHLGSGGEGSTWFYTPGVSEFSFILDGREYSPKYLSGYLEGVGSIYSSTTLERKEHTSGYLVYEIPTSSDLASTYLQADLSEDDSPIWKLG
ncbi:hypothetical protein E2N92_12625 [Methanofollis formosanus]|uniref:Uncharacterized protein n=1 Tax=Methanofollis formosanus TaxID=299308 RepID=A0A8G1A4E3_9EURY|nr:hypothetical protein [Methanofollis formosanus]QYZ80214.1 hypothetical protein E2N92_12625 [Methanofollis formosanus]